MNVDVGGGTAKIAVCAGGKVIDVAALNVGARLIVLDDERRIVRLEEAGRRFGAELGLTLEPGATLAEQEARALAARMAESLFEAMRGGAPQAGGVGLLRLDALSFCGDVSDVSFSAASRNISRRRRQGVRRYRSAARSRTADAAQAMGSAAGAARRAHPRHRDRGLAIYDAGVRLDDFRVAARNAAAAQRAGDCTRAPAWR